MASYTLYAMYAMYTNGMLLVVLESTTVDAFEMYSVFYIKCLSQFSA
jgi:hypothetical protein